MSAWLGFFRSLVIYHSPATLRAWRRFYKDFLSPGDLAFDVGAHVGTRARAMRAAGAKVVALEPQAPFAGFLRRTLPRDITLLEVAAGPRRLVTHAVARGVQPVPVSVQIATPSPPNPATSSAPRRPGV
jgi:hypothetical protein